MGLISRIVTFVNGTTASATEVNAELDNILTTVNGNIDNANVSASAAIAATKVAEIPPARVLDHADTDSEYMTGSTPGTTAVLSRPSTLEGELERIRYRFQADKKFLFVSYMDAAGVAQSLGWVEPSISGQNILPNNGFETKSSAVATDAPDAWTKVGTPDGLTIVTTAEVAFGANKRALLIDGRLAATGDGVSVTLKGLKSSTKYLIGMAYVRVGGTVRLTTSGGLSGVAYQNLSLTAAAGTSASYIQGVVSTNATPADLVVTLDCAANDTSYRVYQVWAFEMAERSGLEIPAIAMQTATYSTANDTLTNAGAGAWSNRSGLSLSQYIPFRGYRLTYEVTVCFKGTTIGGSGQSYEYAFRLQQTIDAGAAATVEGPYSCRIRNETANEFGGATVSLKYVIENPVPGSTYAFTTDVYTEGDGANEADTIIFNPTVGAALATQSQARLVVERI